MTRAGCPLGGRMLGGLAPSVQDCRLQRPRSSVRTPAPQVPKAAPQVPLAAWKVGRPSRLRVALPPVASACREWEATAMARYRLSPPRQAAEARGSRPLGRSRSIRREARDRPPRQRGPEVWSDEGEGGEYEQVRNTSKFSHQLSETMMHPKEATLEYKEKYL